VAPPIQTVCSETSEYKLQTAENHPEERIQHSEQVESLKSRMSALTMYYFNYNWTITFTVHVTNLINVDFLLFINSKFTTRHQNVLRLNECTNKHVWS